MSEFFWRQSVMRWGMVALLVFATCAVSCAASTSQNEQGVAAQVELLRHLKPSVIIELNETLVNEYLLTNPEELAIPAGFTDPMVRFRENRVEVSARRDIGFVHIRVSVEMEPEVQDGALALRVTKIRAGSIWVPRSLHMGVSEMIRSTINSALETHEMRLKRVEISGGVMRATTYWLDEEKPAEK